ncbi:MAG: ABC-type transport auxiliary lipoprotein family protein [Desulfosoma sp.]
MKMKVFFAMACLMAITAGGCSALFPTSAPPMYYQIQVPLKSLQVCNSPKKEPLRIWPLDGPAPYDRNALVLMTSSHTVQVSSRHRWITNPGEMLAQAVTEAALQAQIFSVVNVPGSPGSVPELQLAGRIREFAFHVDQEKTQAVLDVRIILWREAKPQIIVFQKSYRVTEPAFKDASPEELTETMSRAVARWIQELMNDLCQASLNKVS